MSEQISIRIDSETIAAVRATVTLESAAAGKSVTIGELFRKAMVEYLQRTGAVEMPKPEPKQKDWEAYYSVERGWERLPVLECDCGNPDYSYHRAAGTMIFAWEQVSHPVVDGRDNSFRAKMNMPEDDIVIGDVLSFSQPAGAWFRKKVPRTD